MDVNATQSKMTTRGTPTMMVNYALDHPSGTYGYRSSARHSYAEETLKELIIMIKMMKIQEIRRMWTK